MDDLLLFRLTVIWVTISCILQNVFMHGFLGFG